MAGGGGGGRGPSAWRLHCFAYKHNLHYRAHSTIQLIVSNGNVRGIYIEVREGEGGRKGPARGCGAFKYF